MRCLNLCEFPAGADGLSVMNKVIKCGKPDIKSGRPDIKSGLPDTMSC